MDAYGPDIQAPGSMRGILACAIRIASGYWSVLASVCYPHYVCMYVRASIRSPNKCEPRAWLADLFQSALGGKV